MTQYFHQIKSELTSIKAHTPINLWDAFFIQEVLRFNSIAGTICLNFNNVKTSIDERIITHILIRSLIENFFRILYIYDNAYLSRGRFDECVNGFKVQYAKLYNDPSLPNKNQIEPSDPSWASLKSSMDLNSMLMALWNAHGNRLDYLYFVYRISSFDTHGNSLESLFRAAFSKTACNFPVLDTDKVIELIANDYWVIWRRIKST